MKPQLLEEAKKDDRRHRSERNQVGSISRKSNDDDVVSRFVVRRIEQQDNLKTMVKVTPGQISNIPRHVSAPKDEARSAWTERIIEREDNLKEKKSSIVELSNPEIGGNSFVAPSERIDAGDDGSLHRPRQHEQHSQIRKRIPNAKHEAQSQGLTMESDDEERPGAYRIGGNRDADDGSSVYMSTTGPNEPSLLPVTAIDNEELAAHYRYLARQTMRERFEAELPNATQVNTATLEPGSRKKPTHWLPLFVLLVVCGIVGGVVVWAVKQRRSLLD